MPETQQTPETTTNGAPDAKPATAPKATATKRKGKKGKKAAAKPNNAAKPTANGKMIKPWRQVLTILAKGGALTRQGIAAAVQKRLKDTLVNNRVAQESKTYAALAERGYIKVHEVDVEGRAETCHEITAAGRKALDAAK
jgi:hypothetical protein